MAMWAKNFLALCYIFPSLLLWIYRQRKFLKSQLSFLLDPNNEVWNELQQRDKDKIIKKYGLIVPGIVGEAICKLRGKPMTAKERLALTYAGAMTGLYDDFFDQYNKSPERIKLLTSAPETSIPEDIQEKLFLYCYNELIRLSGKEIKKSLIKVMDAQLHSKDQEKDYLSQEEIKKITYNKGGQSVLFYYTLLRNKPNPEDKQLVESIGALLQLENDIFDCYKDREEHILTLATTTQSIDALRSEYITVLGQCIECLKQTNHTPSNKIFFRQLLTVFISLGFVCLDCLEKNEKETNGKFLLNTYSRFQLICDIAKIKNILNALKYYLSLKNKIVMESILNYNGDVGFE